MIGGRKTSKWLCVLVMGWMCVGTLNGCGLEIATLAAAGNSGKGLMGRGKFQAAVAADKGDVYNAAILSQEELGLILIKEKPRSRQRLQLTFEDTFGKDIRIYMQQRAPMLTRLEVNIGWFGHDSTGLLLIDRIRHHLGRIMQIRTDAPPPLPDLLEPPEFEETVFPINPYDDGS